MWILLHHNGYVIVTPLSGVMYSRTQNSEIVYFTLRLNYKWMFQSAQILLSSLPERNLKLIGALRATIAFTYLLYNTIFTMQKFHFLKIRTYSAVLKDFL